ncbi:MAG: molecular chaperone DnaJ [Thermoleophilia bacterium]|nr:molecular chaperone DnaJ [Thermoleophilia bacterium]
MATAERDYYEILGVPRTASEGEIKKAFRRLAREVHPDVSDAPDAQERFREVAEAYEVLSKAETRELYDRYGRAGLRGRGYEPGHFDFGTLSDIFSAFFGDDLLSGRATNRRARGADLLAEIEIDLAEAATGTTRRVPFAVDTDCPRCEGRGAEPGARIETCATCEGTGAVRQVAHSVFGSFVRAETCPRCGGAGRLPDEQCRECGGGGRGVEERALDVTIPAGIHDGQRIRISGEGHSGSRGGRAGDVYVLVHVKPDPRFVREGDDIFSSVELTMTQAALGARVPVPTLDGEVEIDLPPGTQPGELVVLRGRGMPMLQRPRRGDHRVLVSVRVPERVTPEQRRLLEEFERLGDERTYGQGEGLLGKLKSAFR